MYLLIRDDALTWELNMIQCEKISYARYRLEQVPLKTSDWTISERHWPKQVTLTWGELYTSLNSTFLIQETPKNWTIWAMNSLGPYVFSKSIGLPTTCFFNSKIRPASLCCCCGSADTEAVTNYPTDRSQDIFERSKYDLATSWPVAKQNNGLDKLGLSCKKFTRHFMADSEEFVFSSVNLTTLAPSLILCLNSLKLTTASLISPWTDVRLTSFSCSVQLHVLEEYLSQQLFLQF